MIVLRRLYSRRATAAKYVPKTKKDPGIYRQKKVLQESPDDIDPIDFDELESDFMSVHRSHKQHVEEMETWKEKEKYLIVKQKYFKEKYPNFLTWHDKEQIRYLYNTNSEEWSIERLSEGFPASPDIIEKIVKGKWTKENRNKISNHDRTVLQNWDDFKKGKLNNLPSELKEHLQKFTSRTLNFEPFKKSDGKDIVMHNEIKRQQTSCGEFSEIIASYQRLKGENIKKEELNQENVKYTRKNSSNEDNHFKFKAKDSHKLVTLKELKDDVEQQIAKGKNISIQDKLLTTTNFPNKEDATIELKQEDISSIVEHRHKTNSDQIGFLRKRTRNMSHLIYPDKIVIPEEIYKKGYTYKLNDCYYDSDGEFLYRVPGMG